MTDVYKTSSSCFPHFPSPPIRANSTKNSQPNNQINEHDNPISHPPPPPRLTSGIRSDGANSTAHLHYSSSSRTSTNASPSPPPPPTRGHSFLLSTGNNLNGSNAVQSIHSALHDNDGDFAR